MTEIPVSSENAVFVRVDYTDDMAWSELVVAVTAPNEDGFVAYVDFVSDPGLDGFTPEDVRRSMPSAYQHHYVFVADAETFGSAERRILVLGLDGDSAADFRTVPSGVQSIDNNLSISNMDFEEFSQQAILDGGVFRDF